MEATFFSVHTLAWFAPSFVVVFAGIRALGLGWRQGALLSYLKRVEVDALPQTDAAWAHALQSKVLSLRYGQRSSMSACWLRLSPSPFCYRNRLTNSEVLLRTA